MKAYNGVSRPSGVHEPVVETTDSIGDEITVAGVVRVWGRTLDPVGDALVAQMAAPESLRRGRTTPEALGARHADLSAVERLELALNLGF